MQSIRMDYPYFTAAQPPYFIGLPPTPSGSNGSMSDNFSVSPPQDNYEYQSFDHYQHYNNATVPLGKPPTPHSKPSLAGSLNNAYDMPLDLHDNSLPRGDSNSDNEDNANLPPAQSRRKAQNRAAQRAFRERKERHVKDLEAKLAMLEKNQASVVEENERQRLQIQKLATENEILKATTGAPHRNDSQLANHGPMHYSPKRYSPQEFYSEILESHENKMPSHRIVASKETGERLLAAGATWEYIIRHPLFQRGLVDVGDVSERLKNLAKCDGQGPVFEERAIIEAIERSVASGSDELLI